MKKFKELIQKIITSNSFTSAKYARELRNLVADSERKGGKMEIDGSKTSQQLHCIKCGKELTWETAIGYIPPHKSWVCWFYCKECFERNVT